MPDRRLTENDLRTLLLWILIGVAGTFVAFRYFHDAFPEAAVDFRVSRAQARDSAQQFLSAAGHRLERYESSIVFRVDENAKTYLEREAGLEQANRLMATQISVWYWDVRFFRPQQQEEFRVQVSPAGRVVGFSHTIEEARAGARLDREAAQGVAETFLRTHLGKDFSDYDFLPAESNSIDRPNRRDWSFTWERRGFKAPAREDGAPYRVRVSLQGDAPSGVTEFLKVPDAWQRSYDKLRSSNTFYGTVALIPYLFLNLAVLWVLFDLGRRGLVRWSGALKLGLVLAALFFAMTANAWPITRADYDTNASYASFLVEHLAIAAFESLILGLLVALTLVAAEPLYRTSQPEQLRLNVAWTLPGVRTKEFFRSCIIGLGFAAGHIGFVVIFYLVGRWLGVWAPQDIGYTNVVSTALPWLYPLTIGAYAATSEEFLFRLFAIPFLLKVTRSRVLAVVLPAFFWGFLHSTYPQEPGYIRGIEVGVIGIVAGLVMLRYGILATLVWHYTVDALLISLFLLRSGNWYFRASGAVVAAGCFIPLLISGAYYLLRHQFESDQGLLNRDELLLEQPAEAPAAAPSVAAPELMRPLTPTLIKVLLGCGALGILLVAFTKPPAIGDFVRFQVDAKQASEKADEFLTSRGVRPDRYHHTTTVVQTSDAYVNEFLRRKVGIAETNRLYRDKVPIALWRARYFRDGEKEEYTVVVHTDGGIHAFHHVLEEKAPGAKLAREDAQTRAETYLRTEKKLDLAAWKLVETKADARPNRTDHTFVWEETQPSAGTGADAAYARVELKVQGDEVSGFRVFFKIPEEWERKQTQRTLPRALYLVWRIIFFFSLVTAAIVVFFKNLRQQAVPWRRLAKWALVALVGSVITTWNVLPQIMANYSTEIPLKTYVAIVSVSLVLLVLLTYLAALFLSGLAWFFLARAFGEQNIPGWRGLPATYYRDAFLIALGGVATLAGFSRLMQLVSQAWPTLQRSLEATLPTSFDSYLPATQAIGSALSRGLLSTAGLGLVVGLVASYAPGYVSKKRWVPWVLLPMTALTLVGDWGSPADFAQRLLIRTVLLGVYWLGVQQIVRFNLPAYFLLFALPGLASAAALLLEQPSVYFRMNGFAVIFAALVLLAWPLAAWQAGRAHQS